MVLLVQKFGGSSLRDLSSVEIIARKVKKYYQLGYSIVVVLSALKGETDRLISLADLVTASCPKREYDALLATGEQISACLLVMALDRIGVKSRSLSGSQAGIKSNDCYKRASITNIDVSCINDLLAKKIIPVITGFQAVNSTGDVTTLGRGGSDTTAVALAAELKADECQIFVDVPGVFTADPKVEKNASLIHKIPISQMLTYSCLGAKVVQKRAVSIAARYKVPLRICPTFTEGPGTVVEYGEDKNMENLLISAVAYSKQQVMLSLNANMASFEQLQTFLILMKDSGLEIEHSIRSFRCEDSEDIIYQLDCMMSMEDYQCYREIVDSWLSDKINVDSRVIRNLAKVSVLGVGVNRGMETTRSVVDELSKSNIHFYALQGTDQQLTVMIDEKYVELAVRSLHQKFNLDKSNKEVVRKLERVD